MLYLQVAAVTQTSFQAKLKLDENDHDLKVALDTFFVLETFHFFENINYVSLTFWKFRKSIKKMKICIIVDFIFRNTTNRTSHQHVLWKMLSIKCRKTAVKNFKKKLNAIIKLSSIWIWSLILSIFNCLLKCAEQISCQTSPNSGFYTHKKFTQYLKITWLSARINTIPSRH